MASRNPPPCLDKSEGRLRRALRYAFYDWTREMPAARRVITWTGLLLQGYAVWASLTRSLVWPLIWPTGLSLYATAWALYVFGGCLMNGMLTSELVRKTQLEADLIAARQIQETLQPRTIDAPPGYAIEAFYQPFRDVGGDYFDVIALPGDRTLVAIADVSGKGMPAALLAANIQALVRSIAHVDADPLVLARRINEHLCRYTPSARFATALFVVLSRDTGELRYVNAGHNPAIVSRGASTTLLGGTGLPLGLFAEAAHEIGDATIAPGGALLLFTDGLTDSIPGDDPEGRLRAGLAAGPQGAMSRIKALVDPAFNEDDVAILLLKREAAA